MLDAINLDLERRKKQRYFRLQTHIGEDSKVGLTLELHDGDFGADKHMLADQLHARSARWSLERWPHQRQRAAIRKEGHQDLARAWAPSMPDVNHIFRYEKT